MADQAYQKVRERILHGDLTLGTTVSRRKLAAEYGMSFVPIAEALQRLEAEGLIESRPRVGTRVRIPTAQDIREHYILREALETQSARLFAEKASPDERRELLRVAEHLDKLDAEVGGHDDHPEEILFAAHQLHIRLHDRLAECTGCSALRRAIELNQTLCFKWLYDTAYRRPKLPPRWHQQLMEAVGGTDPEIAEAAMRRHIRHGLEAVLGALEPYLGWEQSNVRGFSKAVSTLAAASR